MAHDMSIYGEIQATENDDDSTGRCIGDKVHVWNEYSRDGGCSWSHLMSHIHCSDNKL